MDCPELNMVTDKLQELYEVLSQLMPLTHADTHPFSYFKHIINSIVENIDKETKGAEVALEAEKAENKRLEGLVTLYCAQMNTKPTDIALDDNIFVARAFLEKELTRIGLLRAECERELNALRAEITTQRDWLGMEEIKHSESISLAELSKLRAEVSLLLQKREEREKGRQALYDKIEELVAKLGRSSGLTFDEKICDLEQMANDMEHELQKNKARWEEISKDVRRRESLVGEQPTVWPVAYDSGALDKMEARRGWLVEEQMRRFDGLYEAVSIEMAEMNKIFGLPSCDYPRTQEGLEDMKARIREMVPKKDLFCEIAAQVEQRRLLVQKMTEFERIASDPQRLFKSSFQLNTEEKFRNTAYPTLLRMEQGIFERIEEYEKAFGQFIYEGVEYKESLRREVENRIINRTVFISRCDSPYKRKK